MEPFRENFKLLELISCPAYFVKDGVVDAVNSGAQNLLIAPGTCAASLIATGKEDYETLAEGSCLSVTVETAETQFCAFVCRQDGCDLFLLDQEHDDPTQMALCLASASFRTPLSRVINNIDSIRRYSKTLDSDTEKYLNEISKGAYQILRLVTNMSDVIPYAQGTSACQALDITSELREATQKAAVLLESRNIRLEFSSSIPNTIVMANREQLERALHNLISNAATYASRTEEPRIHVSLRKANNRLYLTVSDNGQGIPDDVFSTLFSRYRRRPSLESCRYGIGLGLPLVRAVAAAHGGTVLVERLQPTGTRVTMSLAEIPYNENLVRSPRLTMDYASEFDHALVELSDIIPADFFGKM